MTLKPPTRTLPRLVMKDWPGVPSLFNGRALTCIQDHQTGVLYYFDEKDLSDFTRVGEGVQEDTPLAKRDSA